MKKIFNKVLCLALSATMIFSLAACGEEPATSTPASVSASKTTEPTAAPTAEPTPEVVKNYTYREYLTISPSNWNELTYQDNNDTEIMSWISSNLFSFDFAFDANGEIIPGDFEVEYSAATKLEDVSSKVDAKWGVPEGGKGYAWKITLRDDLKWEDGTPIKAEDFVYTMQQQLDPLFQNYRADSYYAGSTVLVNAEAYAKQGQVIEAEDNSSTGMYTVEDLVKGDDGVYTQPDGTPIFFALTDALSWCSGYSVTDYAAYMDADAFASLQALANEAGRVPVTDETIALVTKLIDTDDWGHEPAENVPYYMVYPFTYPAIDFSEVGIFTGDNEYEIVIVLKKALNLVKEDGSLSYQAAYNMASLPLVNKAMFESCKIAPSEGSTLWTSNYNSSKETTMSWGPYKLESFQAGKQFTLVKNENWFGYGLEQYAGQYQTTAIVCDIIDEWNSAWLEFKAGNLDGIGIDVSIADEYKGSDQAYFTPDDYIQSMQLQSDKAALKARETEGINKTLLAYSDFRKALSLGVNRDDFATKTTTSSLAGFGIFNSMHYYDVENGGAYRNTDEARQVLCNVYAVDASQYASLKDAENAITGYNLTEARKLLTNAYNEALANGDIKETDKVFLTFGSGAITETVQRRVDYLGNAFKELAVGTPLEGRIDYEFKDYSTKWSNDFRDGVYDICMGGWTGADWDPGYFLMAYLSPDYMYSKAWDTSSQMMTFTMKGVAEDGGDITDTMSLMDWYNCLNGLNGKYDWSDVALPNSKRLQLIAALEEQILAAYYTVPLYYNFAASLISFKLDYITYDYNTFMGYGGLRYATYNYDDDAWAEVVKQQNGELNYK